MNKTNSMKKNKKQQIELEIIQLKNDISIATDISIDAFNTMIDEMFPELEINPSSIKNIEIKKKCLYTVMLFDKSVLEKSFEIKDIYVKHYVDNISEILEIAISTKSFEDLKICNSIFENMILEK